MEPKNPAPLPVLNRLLLLQQEFFKMTDQFNKLLSDPDPSDRKQFFWAVFIGALLKGDRHYACHIVEDLPTRPPYNSVDPQYDYPVLVFGQPLYMKDDLIAAIRGNFPPELKDILPVQIAFSIRYNDKTALPGQLNSRDLINLIKGTSPVLFRNIQVSYLDRHVGNTLSFRRDGVPFQFWTHKSRVEALERVKIIEESGFKTKSPEEQKEILHKFSVYGDLIKLHKEVRANLQKEKKASEDLETAKDVLAKYKDCVDNLAKDPSYKPENGLEWLKAADQPKVINGKEEKVNKAEEAFEEAKSYYDTSKTKLKEEIQNHSMTLKLPNSFVYTTFQFALDVVIDNQEIYKQFDGQTGGLLYCLNIDKENVNHIRFLDNVHIPYSD